MDHMLKQIIAAGSTTSVHPSTISTIYLAVGSKWRNTGVVVKQKKENL